MIKSLNTNQTKENNEINTRIVKYLLSIFKMNKNSFRFKNSFNCQTLYVYEEKSPELLTFDYK